MPDGTSLKPAANGGSGAGSLRRKQLAREPVDPDVQPSVTTTSAAATAFEVGGLGKSLPVSKSCSARSCRTTGAMPVARRGAGGPHGDRACRAAAHQYGGELGATGVLHAGEEDFGEWDPASRRAPGPRILDTRTGDRKTWNESAPEGRPLHGSSDVGPLVRRRLLAHTSGDRPGARRLRRTGGRRQSPRRMKYASWVWEPTP